jgi:lysozyme family protein
MRDNFETSLEKVLAHEGGFSNHPSDPGGATMKGVTLAVYQAYFGADKTVDELKKITQEELHIIYKRGYWDACKCDLLPSGLDYVAFDFAVNSGVSRAVKSLQRALRVISDGKIGPKTLAAIEKFNRLDLIDDLCADRMHFLTTLGTFAEFGKGWKKRVADVRTSALAMAK